MPDFQAVVLGAVVNGLVSLIIGGIIGEALRRWMNKRDLEVQELNRDVKVLREEKFKALADALGAHEKCDITRFDHAANARKKIYEEITYLRTHFVHVEACAKIHQQTMEDKERFIAAVGDLRAVQKSVEILTTRLEGINEQQIAIIRDLGRVEGPSRKGGT